MMILTAFSLLVVGALVLVSRSVVRDAASTPTPIAADAERPSLPARAARLARGLPAAPKTDEATAPEQQNDPTIPRTIGQMLTAQADEVCACDSQACVDQVLIDYAIALGAAPSAPNDEAELKASAHKMATCRHAQEAKWGLPSSDNHPISVNDRPENRNQEQPR